MSMTKLAMASIAILASATFATAGGLNETIVEDDPVVILPTSSGSLGGGGAVAVGIGVLAAVALASSSSGSH